MKDMGKRPLLDRTGEIEIAMQIEQGNKDVQNTLSTMPQVSSYIVEKPELIESESDITEVVVSFLDQINDVDVNGVIQGSVKTQNENIENDESTDDSDDSDDLDDNLFLDTGPDPELLDHRLNLLDDLNKSLKQKTMVYPLMPTKNITRNK